MTELGWLVEKIPVPAALQREGCFNLSWKRVSMPLSVLEVEELVGDFFDVLEDRVRELTGFAGKASGAELFSATMARDPCLIRVGSENDVQEAAHPFFRGYSGLVRNEVMHRLVESYTKERVIQLLGTVDYLLFLLSKAQVQRANGAS
jgi:RNase P/RNase MRP subunit p29